MRPSTLGWKRRRFLAAASAVLAAPNALGQQPGRLYRVGYVVLAPDPADPILASLRQGLRELGWHEGKNYVLETQHADSKIERIPAVATELAQRKVDVFMLGHSVMRHAVHATGSAPVVFVIADDPVREGYVASFARPGGRVTGFTSLNVDLDGKRLEVLKTALPGANRVGVLSDTRDRTHSDRIAAAERAARTLGLQLKVLEVLNPKQFAGAFEAARNARVDAVMMVGSPYLYTYQARVAELATKARLPVVSAWREFPEAGGLLSYGTNITELWRRAAQYGSRILKGESPGDLPVQQAAAFELIVNLKVAKALGVTIPKPVILRADKVIE